MSFWKTARTRDLEAEVFRLRAALATSESTNRQREIDLRLDHEKEFGRLNAMLVYERQQHADLMARADTEAVNRELLFRTQTAELKNIHAEELKRVIEESQRLRSENERFRLLYSPVDRKTPSETEESSTQPSSRRTTFGEMVAAGTPWQRIQARYIAEELARGVADNVPATPPNEVTENADGQPG